VGKRPTGKMVPITDADIRNLKYIKDAAKTLTTMAEWTGYTSTSISKWFKGETHEMLWRHSVKKKIAKVARELNPEPVMAVRVPVFNCEHPLMEAYRLARDPDNIGNLSAASAAFRQIAAILAHKILEG